MTLHRTAFHGWETTFLDELVHVQGDWILHLLQPGYCLPFKEHPALLDNQLSGVAPIFVVEALKSKRAIVAVGTPFHIMLFTQVITRCSYLPMPQLGDFSISGLWSKTESLLRINVLDLNTLLLSLKPLSGISAPTPK